MTSKKDKKQSKKEKVKFKKENSSISEFIKRPLPTDEEMGKFEDYIYDKMEESHKKGSQLFNDKEREEEIKSSLSEIYKDSKGNKVNVEKMDIKKRRGVIFWFFITIFLFFMLLGVGLSGYYYVYNASTNLEDIKVEVKGKEKVGANEEVVYTIECKNGSRVALEDIRVNLSYSDNFLFIDSSPTPEQNNNSWYIQRIPPNSSEEIEVRGRVIDKKGASSVILATMHYLPANFSSEFKKEDSFSTVVKSIGFQANMDNPQSMLVGEKGVISFDIDSEEENHVNEFKILADIPENFTITDYTLTPEDEESKATMEEVGPKAWNIKGLIEGSYSLDIEFEVGSKASSTEDMKFNFIKEVSGQEFGFLQKNAAMEVMESDLDLNLIIEGSQKDQPVNFGQKLNYTLTYANRGDSAMNNVVLMAVLDSEFLDWTTLDMEQKGVEKGHAITWGKEQIPDLEELAPGEQGTIDLTIDVLSFREDMLNSNDDFQIESYAQFSMGGDATSTQEGSDNKSNTIVNAINSDLDLDSEVRYFNENNLPVGTGPLPPQVGEETTFKAYWTITNNLHELEETRVRVELPDHISWNGKQRTSVGDIKYNEDDHEVVWEIGKMPITVYRVDAQFDISLTPSQEDENKILILLPKSVVTAKDKQTGDDLERSTEPTTTKLEDDEIANMNNDGRVQ